MKITKKTLDAILSGLWEKRRQFYWRKFREWLKCSTSYFNIKKNKLKITRHSITFSQWRASTCLWKASRLTVSSSSGSAGMFTWNIKSSSAHSQLTYGQTISMDKTPSSVFSWIFEALSTRRRFAAFIISVPCSAMSSFNCAIRCRKLRFWCWTLTAWPLLRDGLDVGVPTLLKRYTVNS